jgi:hypothetical protein
LRFLLEVAGFGVVTFHSADRFLGAADRAGVAAICRE